MQGARDGVGVGKCERVAQADQRRLASESQEVSAALADAGTQVDQLMRQRGGLRTGAAAEALTRMAGSVPDAAAAAAAGSTPSPGASGSGRQRSRR